MGPARGDHRRHRRGRRASARSSACPIASPLPLTVALPAWWLGHLALLGRPVANAASGNGAAPAAPALEWYPVGRILLWIAGFAVLTTIAALLTLGTDAEAITGTLRRGLLRILGPRDAASASDIERWVDALVIIAPAAAAIVAMMTLTLNLWLAAKIAATSGRLHRPWPDLKSDGVAADDARRRYRVALAFCFIGGLSRCSRRSSRTALMMAYAIIGFAVLHTLTLALKSRAFWLGCAYAIVVVFGWPVLAMVALGLADAVFGFRQRYPARQAAALARILEIYPSTQTCNHRSPLQRRTNMEVILLERVAKLGQMGEVVRVKDGFARNFLLKRGKALRATADNRAKFDGMKAELEANNLKAKGEATKVAEKIDGRNVVVLRQASETGQLFGSVSVRDIIASFEADGSPSAAARSCSTRRSRPSASTRSRSPCIRKSKSASASPSRAAPMKPSASTAAKTSRPARKTRTPPPKRSPPPANSSIRKPSTTTPSRRPPRTEK